MTAFDLDVYRKSNQDLEKLSDKELQAHFDGGGYRERRPFAHTNTAAETMSMRWLRGRGLEIGAGKHPTPLFGDAVCEYADIAADSAFGGAANVYFDLESPDGNLDADIYDFIIAAHVLEHCNSFIRAIENLISALDERGVAYIVLPDKRFMIDQTWMPEYDFGHHAEEYNHPLKFANEHDSKFINSATADLDKYIHADIDEEFEQGMREGKLPADQRFLTHKHNYSYSEWFDLISKSLKFLGSDFEVGDSMFGRHRMDCHFILARAVAH